VDKETVWVQQQQALAFLTELRDVLLWR